MTLTTTIPARRQAIEADTYTREQVELLKRTVAAGTSDDEFALFMATAQRNGLDPFTGQIHCVMRSQKTDDGHQKKMSIQTGIDGYRLIAERTGRYEGRLGPLWCGTDGQWRDVWLEENPPAAAKVGVYKAGNREPLWAVALWTEYRQTTSKGALTRMWQQMPAAQLAKCAEALALRAAFPQDLSGLYTTEEMGQADNERSTTTVQQHQTSAAAEVRSGESEATPGAADDPPPAGAATREATPPPAGATQAVPAAVSALDILKDLCGELHVSLEDARDHLISLDDYNELKAANWQARIAKHWTAARLDKARTALTTRYGTLRDRAAAAAEGGEGR